LSDILLSAAMIVRNEERFIEECLLSIKEVVDEVVIVDTGSTDRTMEIALQHGAKVYDFPWTGDFAAARNRALEHSGGEWILYIDADERLRPADKSYVRDILSDRGKAGYTVRFYPIVGYTFYREYRIFRNDPRIRFEGVIHESMLSPLKTFEKEEGLTIGEADLTIDHVGYEGDLTHKHARNLPMLKEQIENDPARIYLRWQLGVSLKGLGDKEGAEKAWLDAIEIIRNKRKARPEDSHPYYDLIKMLYEEGRDCSELLGEASKLFPGNYLITWTRAMMLMDGDEYEEAAGIFEYLVSIDPGQLDNELLAYNSKIFDELSYEPLAACYYRLGRYGDSARCYSLAEKCDPENPEYRTKRMFVETLVNKS